MNESPPNRISAANPVDRRPRLEGATENNKASHPQQKFIHDDVGPQYITINVKSLRVVLERLAKLNTLLLGSSPTPLNARSHFALVQDPDGNFIELIGPMEEVQK